MEAAEERGQLRQLTITPSSIAGFRLLNKPSFRGVITNRYSRSRRQLARLLALALGSVAIIPVMQAGEAQVSVRAFAQALAVNASGEQSVGTPGSFHSTASATALYNAGLSNAFVHTDASALTGALHANYLANVSADNRVQKSAHQFRSLHAVTELGPPFVRLVGGDPGRGGIHEVTLKSPRSLFFTSPRFRGVSR